MTYLLPFWNIIRRIELCIHFKEPGHFRTQFEFHNVIPSPSLTFHQKISGCQWVIPDLDAFPCKENQHSSTLLKWHTCTSINDGNMRVFVNISVTVFISFSVLTFLLVLNRRL